MAWMVATGSVVGTLVALVWLFGSISFERVPARVWPFQGGLGVALAGAGWAVVAEPTPGVVGLAVLTAVLGGMLLALLAIRKVPAGERRAMVGQPLPPLTALDDAGRPFDLETLTGRRVMVKFFRGSW